MKRIILVSQNLLKYDIDIPLDAILRMNLAWHKDLRSARELIEEYQTYDVFLDVPIGRKKPPNFEHNFEEIRLLIHDFPNIKYVAISNVESAKDVKYFQERIFEKPAIKIVPKIETYAGVENSKSIIGALNYKPAILMLDHQDLYSDLVRLNKEVYYLNIVDFLMAVCKRKGAKLLRTIGIVFSTEEVK